MPVVIRRSRQHQNTVRPYCSSIQSHLFPSFFRSRRNRGRELLTLPVLLASFDHLETSRISVSRSTRAMCNTIHTKITYLLLILEWKRGICKKRLKTERIKQNEVNIDLWNKICEWKMYRFGTEFRYQKYLEKLQREWWTKRGISSCITILFPISLIAPKYRNEGYLDESDASWTNGGGKISPWSLTSLDNSGCNSEGRKRLIRQKCNIVGVPVGFISAVSLARDFRTSNERVPVRDGRERIGRRHLASLFLSPFPSFSLHRSSSLSFVPRRGGADSLARGTRAFPAEHPRQFHVDGHPARLAAAKVGGRKEEGSSKVSQRMNWRTIVSEARRGASCSREWPRLTDSRDRIFIPDSDMTVRVDRTIETVLGVAGPKLDGWISSWSTRGDLGANRYIWMINFLGVRT